MERRARKGDTGKKFQDRIFGFDHLDSGMLYRIYAYELLKKKKIQEIEKIKIDIQLFKKKTFYNSKDLRSETVSKTASLIAKNEFIREQLVILKEILQIIHLVEKVQ